jgi:hypothetical protein
MRGINITNDKNRDAVVAFDARAPKSAITMALPDGKEKHNRQFIKTLSGFSGLTAKYRNLAALGQAITAGDPEIDIETTGRFINGTHKMCLTADGNIAYRVQTLSVTYNPDGSEKERTQAAKYPANINTNIPLKWTCREFPKEEALRKFVFTRNYQLRHTSGLSYDFLYDMAKQLCERNTMMLVGAGAKGAEALRLSLGGAPYRAFLEGRIDGGSYCLILHLSNMELRGVS